jgi:hypothetical protein
MFQVDDHAQSLTVMVAFGCSVSAHASDMADNRCPQCGVELLLSGASDVCDGNGSPNEHLLADKPRC